MISDEPAVYPLAMTLVLPVALLLGSFSFLTGPLSQDPLDHIRNNLDSYLKRWVEEYATYIITNEEREVFSALATTEQKLAFIETFWERRDPTPGTSANEFREVFARRFAHANANFRTARPGWKTDRGRIYILLGQPDYIDRNPMGRGSMERSSEVWTYMKLHHPELPPSLEIRFVDFFGNGDYEIASDLGAAHIRPTGFLPAFSDLDYFGQRRAYPYQFTDAGPIQVDEGSLSSDRFNFLQDLRSAESPPEARPRPLSALVDTGVTFTTLPFDLGIQLLRDPAGGGQMPVALALRYDNLAARPSSGRSQFSIDVYAELRHDQGKIVDRLDRQLNFNLTAEEMTSLGAESLRYFFMLSAPPGSYRLHFLVRDNVGNSLGTQEEPVMVPSGSEGLITSSLILADRIEQLEPAELAEETRRPTNPFVFGEVRVLPNPSRVFVRGQPMHVYFQVYGLTLREGKNSLSVEYSFLRSDQMLWEPAQVRLYPTSETSRAIFSSFDTGKFPPGRLTLRVKIEDLAAGRTLTREVGFLIR